MRRAAMIAVTQSGLRMTRRRGMSVIDGVLGGRVSRARHVICQEGSPFVGVLVTG